MTRCRGRLQGRFKVQPRGYVEIVWNKQDFEAEECYIVKEAIDIDSIECFDHVNENCASWHLFAHVPDYSFNEAGQLQGRAMPGSEPKLLVSHYSANSYFM